MTIALDIHPVLRCTQALRSALTDVAELDPSFMPTREKASALVAIGEVMAAASALQARLLAGAEDVAADGGSRDAAAWLAAVTHGDYRSHRRSLDLGRSLESAPLVLAAMAAGQIDLEKVRVILRALEALPDTATAELRTEAEQALVSHAPGLSPKALAKLGRHLEAIVDPDHADEAESRALLREERTAHELTSLRITPRFDGTARISGVIPEAAAHRLRTFIEAYAQPRKLEGEVCRPHQRFGRAFCDLIERIDPTGLPDHGGDATTVMVTIPLADLLKDLGVGSLGGLDAETRISAGEARRLACTAGIIPVVLGSRGQVLDLGRTQRLFTPAQRKALRVRHSTCQVDGCDVPATWCDAHHEDPWSRGGRTDLSNALLVCGHHHRRLHDSRYASTRSGDRINVHLRR